MEFQTSYPGSASDIMQDARAMQAKAGARLIVALGRRIARDMARRMHAHGVKLGHSVG